MVLINGIYENLFSNNLFLIGALIGIIIKSILIYKRDIIDNMKFLLWSIGLLAVGNGAYLAFKGLTFNDFLGTMTILILVISIVPLIFDYDKYSRRAFNEININNLFLPLFILIYMTFNNLVFYTITFIILFLLVIFSKSLPTIIENILYPIYILAYALSFIFINLGLENTLINNLNEYFSYELSIFLLGIGLSIIFYMCMVYLLFIGTYIPGKRERNYLSRIKKRSKFIKERFKNKINVPITATILISIFIGFTYNTVYKYLEIDYMIIIFLLGNQILFMITNKEPNINIDEYNKKERTEEIIKY